MPKFNFDIPTITFAILLIGSTTGALTHFAKADELEELRFFTKMSFTEMRLEQTQEKRNQYLAIPQEHRQDWQQRELNRLDDVASKLERRLEAEMAQQQSGGWW